MDMKLTNLDHPSRSQIWFRGFSGSHEWCLKSQDFMIAIAGASHAHGQESPEEAFQRHQALLESANYFAKRLHLNPSSEPHDRFVQDWIEFFDHSGLS